MTKDTDYGVVPGTGTKPTLLKPGAEKLPTFFGLAPVFVSECIVEEFGDDGREPLFFWVGPYLPTQYALTCAASFRSRACC